MGWITDVVQRGTPFTVALDLNLAAGGYSLVRTPTVNKICPGTIGGDQLNDFRIVLCSYQYDYVADAAAEGFDLGWSDHHTPVVLNRLLRVRSQAAARVEGVSAHGFFAAGPGGIYTPLKNPADLVATIVGTVVTGHLIVSGYICGGDKMAHSYTGSPDLFTVAPVVP